MQLTISRRALAVAVTACSKDNKLPGLQRINFHATGGISSTDKYVLVTAGDCTGETIAAIDKRIVQTVIGDTKRSGANMVLLDTDAGTLGAYLYEYNTDYMEAPIHKLMHDALNTYPEDTEEFGLTEPVLATVHDAVKAYRQHTTSLTAKGNTQYFTHLSKHRCLCEMPGDDDIKLLFMAAIRRL